MKDYRLFDISDFVIDDDFIRWVNEGKKADNDFWNNWLAAHPGKYMVVAEARKILESLRTEELDISAEERENEINRLLLTISGKDSSEVLMETRNIARSISISRRKWWYVAAAIFIGVVGTTGYIFQNKIKGQNNLPMVWLRHQST
jgi:hypothetical protein